MSSAALSARLFVYCCSICDENEFYLRNCSFETAWEFRVDDEKRTIEVVNKVKQQLGRQNLKDVSSPLNFYGNGHLTRGDESSLFAKQSKDYLNRLKERHVCKKKDESKTSLSDQFSKMNLGKT